jgi:hypothetical protein
MTPHDAPGYAVYFFPQALEALGEPIKPYLQDGDCVLCREVDTAGSLVEMTLDARTADGKMVKVELMVPTQMVRMIVSGHGDEDFGFRPRVPLAPSTVLPPVGPTAAPAQAPTQAVPPSVDAPTQTPPKP